MATGTHFREIITIISRPRERFRALVSHSFILTRALRNVKSIDTNGPAVLPVHPGTDFEDWGSEL